MFEQFKLGYYEIILRAGDEGLGLPPYKGSTLRGGFGSTFRQLVCIQQASECKSCLLGSSCPYVYIFETRPPLAAEVLRNYQSIPRPFVLEPPLDGTTEYPPGALLPFRLVLVGRSIQYLPYFVMVFEYLGQIGLGRRRRPYRLEAVEAHHPLTGARQRIYQPDQQTIEPHNLRATGDQIAADIPDKTVNTLTINYLTMTRLKYRHTFTSKVEFHILIRNLLRRLSSLYYFHHGVQLDVDFNDLIAKAEGIKLIEDRTAWVDWERYSQRQESRMTLGGIVGKVVYQGEITPYLPLLRLGELIHVGKGTVFGLGLYQLMYN